MRLALAATLLVLCLDTASSNGNASYQVTTGTEFVEAIIRLAQEGGDVSLELSKSISLENGTWNVEEQAAGRGFFSGSSLAVRGTLSDGPVVLDAAMKAGLAPSNAHTTITWQNIVFVNMCSKSIMLDPSSRLTGIYSNAMFFLPRSRSALNTDRIDCTVYIPRREFLGLLHWLALDLTPFKAIQGGWAKIALEFAPETHAVVTSMDEHSISIEYMELAGGVDYNITYRSTSNPRDPFGFALPPYGSLMPHRLCSPDGNTTGPLLTERQVNTANLTAFPTWIATSSTELLKKFEVISEHAFAKGDGPSAIQDIHIEMVFILKDISLASENLGLQHRPFLLYNTMLRGPLLSRRPNLDFADSEGVLSLGARSTFFIENIALSGLKPVTILTKDGTSELGKSCLKFVAIDRRDRQVVQVAAVTFQIPKDEFLVLVSAANRGANWQDGAPATAYLLQGISVFEPKEHSRSQLLLAKYKGWGVEGADVAFLPLEPPTEQEYQAFLESDKGEVDEVALGVGIGVGVGVGAPTIIASAYLLAVVLRRKRKGLGHKKEDASIHNAPQGQEGSAFVFIKASTQREPSNTEGKAIPTSKQRNGTQEVSGPQCSVSIDSTTPRNLEEAATTLHEESTKATKSFPEASGSPPAHSSSLDKIEIDEGSMPIQKITADQRASFAHHSFDALVRHEVDGLLKAGAHDDSLRLEVLIGKGAWGAVYKGSWKGLTVAVKTVLFTARADEVNKAIPNETRAVLEAAVCISLSHPNIVSTYHYCIKQVRHNENDDKISLHVEGSADVLEDWKLFLVLEYCHCNLGMGIQTGLFGRGNRQNFEKVTHVLLDVAQGALYLHEHHIIHGDLKPDNILLKADSSSPAGLRAKITDFGLSTNLGPTATHASNFRLGTPYYCSPEVAIDGRATKASDVFSFGVVMSELCSGTPPFRKVGGDDYELNPLFPYFPPHVPGAFKDLALRCMNSNVSARPTFKELVSSLQGILQEHESVVQSTGSKGSKRGYV
uniref:Protein kinase domain-containing protein n=1 Tax=Dunaliella tertiolecta TaxID=3047 RepID=A0A7S3VTP2_DUNTE